MLTTLLARTSFLCFFVAFVSGCSVSPQITNTARSSTEQALLVHALERAMTGLDIQKFEGRAVMVDFYGLTGDKDFAREYFTAWLQAQRMRVTVDAREAELRLKVFATVLAVDQGYSFFGAPSFVVPFVGFAMPEIPLFKNVAHSGHAELKISATDARTGEFVYETLPAAGESVHNEYTILILIRFGRSDLDER
jgi:hypothetical protein